MCGVSIQLSMLPVLLLPNWRGRARASAAIDGATFGGGGGLLLSSRSFSSLMRVVLWAADLASFSQGAAPPQWFLFFAGGVRFGRRRPRFFDGCCCSSAFSFLSLSHFLSRRLLFLLLGVCDRVLCESSLLNRRRRRRAFCSSFERWLWLASLSLFRKLLSRRLLSSPSPKALLPFSSPILAISSVFVAAVDDFFGLGGVAIWLLLLLLLLLFLLLFIHIKHNCFLLSAAHSRQSRIDQECTLIHPLCMDLVSIAYAFNRAHKSMIPGNRHRIQRLAVNTL